MSLLISVPDFLPVLVLLAPSLLFVPTLSFCRPVCRSDCARSMQMETRVEKGEEEFNAISKTMRTEIERFEVRKQKGIMPTRSIYVIVTM